MQQGSWTLTRIMLLVCVAGMIGGGACVREAAKKRCPEKTDVSVALTQQVTTQTLTLDCSNGVTMELIRIESGTFTMGSPDNEAQRDNDEGPQHQVTISRAFYLGKFEVTQAQWRAVMGDNPSHFKGDGQLPVEKVSWDDCQEFCRKLSAKTGQAVRLPTEAEWEYACRAGSTGRFCFGDDDDSLGAYAWYGDNSGRKTHPVADRQPNSWGLYDMHGNVWEWCEDWYEPYPGSTAKSELLGRKYRVLRGGSWSGGIPYKCCSANRYGDGPDNRYYNLGLRVAAEAKREADEEERRLAAAKQAAEEAEQRAAEEKRKADAAAAQAERDRQATIEVQRAKEREAARQVTAPTLTLDCGNGVTMELIKIEPDTFLMGSNDGASDEKPPHEVTISRAFYLGKFEVTQAQWRAVMGDNPSHFKGDGQLPVEKVSWDDCQEFCRKLSAKTGQAVRLPTEAEWEYACRAGSTGRFCFGDDDDSLRTYAWYGGNSGRKTHPVGQRQPNAWGLYDLHGNVWEWCKDWDGAYASGRQTDPRGASSGDGRVLRGGSWRSVPYGCRSAYRNRNRPDGRDYSAGLRVAAEAKREADEEEHRVTAAKQAAEEAEQRAAEEKRKADAAAAQAERDRQATLEAQRAKEREAARQVTAPTLTLDCGNGVTMELIRIEPGTFTMGSPDNEAQRDNDEVPQHQVTISRAFYLGKFEVTQTQWQAVMGDNPSYFKGDGQLPVEQVSWNDCQEFCKKLSAKTGQAVRLPTEAEWEYACRAGSTGRFCFGNDGQDLDAYAWYYDNSGSKTHPVGQRQPNAWGLYDLHGNVWEWCKDWYGAYASGRQTDPRGASIGEGRVLRGGCWRSYLHLHYCRSADRNRSGPDYRNNVRGLRVAVESDSE